jgi:hypothetical protein
MQKTYTISEEEYNKMFTIRDDYRKENVLLTKRINELENKLAFIESSAEDVLVIVKDKDKEDRYEFKSKEKDIIRDLIKVNSELREKNEELVNTIKILNQNIENKYLENKNLEEIVEKQVNINDSLVDENKRKKNEYNLLKNRCFIERVFNFDFIERKQKYK